MNFFRISVFLFNLGYVFQQRTNNKFQWENRFNYFFFLNIIIQTRIQKLLGGGGILQLYNWILVC